MVEVWNTLTEGQGSVILGLLTIAAAAIGVSLGSRLFGGKVSDLRGALEESQNAIQQHEASVNQKLATLLDTVAEVEKNVVSALQKINQAGNNLNVEITDLPEGKETEAAVNSLESIRADWEAIRDQVESLVADPGIDGRTRAKYARMDRRNFADLIDAYNYDYQLPGVTKYRKALEIRQRYRNGRTPPTKSDAEEMRRLRNELTGS